MTEKLQLKFAELHNPLFFGGRNFGTKLDPSHKHGLGLFYDRNEKELLVHWEGKVGIIPISNVACMVEGNVELKQPQASHPINTMNIKTAQVSTPFGHVFEGAGAGKTGKSK